MTALRRCPTCGGRCLQRRGRGACAAALVLLGVLSDGSTARAQTTSKASTGVPLPLETTASVVIGAVFQLDPQQPALAESGPPLDRCSPLTCFRGTVTVRSNSRWELQVRIDPARSVSAPVFWLGTGELEIPISSAWRAIGDGIAPSSGVAVGLRFGVGGANAQRPTGAALSSALQFRVIALP